MDKMLLNLGLNNGLPKSILTQAEAIALVEANKRRGGRSVTRKTHTERYAERAAKGKQSPATDPPLVDS